MKKVIFVFIAACTAVLFTGCARELIVAEILQVPEQSVLRTAYNLWYTDPLEMDSVNAQKGTLLPFGTAVKVTKATEDEIFFNTQDGKSFRISYNPNYRMQTIEEYIRELFTLKSAEELQSGLDVLTCEKVRRGIVEKGMSQAAVLLAYGPPCAFRTPSRQASTWLYPLDFLEYKRVIFRNGQVLEIILP